MGVYKESLSSFAVHDILQINIYFSKTCREGLSPSKCLALHDLLWASFMTVLLTIMNLCYTGLIYECIGLPAIFVHWNDINSSHTEFFAGDLQLYLHFQLFTTLRWHSQLTSLNMEDRTQLYSKVYNVVDDGPTTQGIKVLLEMVFIWPSWETAALLGWLRMIRIWTETFFVNRYKLIQFWPDGRHSNQ